MVQLLIITFLSICLIIQAIINRKHTDTPKIIVIEYDNDAYTHIVKIHTTIFNTIQEATYFAYNKNIKYFKLLTITY